MSDTNIKNNKNEYGDVQSTKPVIETSKEPAKKAGKYISDILAVNLGRPVLLLVAGGSAVSVLDHINPECLDENLTVTVTDERFIDEIDENNFENLQTTQFYNELIQVDAMCINTAVFTGDTAEEHADRFNKNVREWISEFSDGIIIALYGVGTDGHIGGIIPALYKGEEFENRFNGRDFVKTVTDTTKASPFPDRVSTTFSFMKLVDYPVIYATGEAKKLVLQKALDPNTSLESIPARIILDMKAPVIFTDIDLK